MPEVPGRRQLVSYLVAGVVIVALGAWWVRSGGDAPARPADGRGVRVARAADRSTIVVHVAGAVRRPGVYRMRAGTRVEGAVRQAGGATARADLDALNLAARVEDGRQVVVPRRGAAAGGAGAPAGPVNLNTATEEQLGTLDGVGPMTARKIIEYREAHGGFGSVDELDQVPGIGPKRLAALREHVTA